MSEKGRALDYYTKGLSIETRQRIFSCLRNTINSVTMKEFREKETGYRSFHRMGLSDRQIEMVWDRQADKFNYINQLMKDNNRPPLFSDINDSCKCATEYFHLMDYVDEEKLIREFGCSYEEYISQTLDNNENAI